MQAAQPLLLYRRTSTLSALRMLSSTPTTLNPRPNLNREINPNHRLINCNMNPSGTESYKKPSNLSPKFDSNFLKFHQSLNPVKCFSVTPATNYVLISGQSPTEVGNCETTDGDVSSESTLVVVSFYKFADFPDHADFRKPLKELCEKLVLF